MLSKPQEVLKRFWGFDSFRPIQSEIIHSVLNNHDTLALLPTGGGKSICFQVPAMVMEGLCLVISPLIALMKDQAEGLRQKGIKAYAIYSGLSDKEIDTLLDNCIYGDVKFLYVSPERLQTDIFMERVKSMKVSLVAVDEAHCISMWGHDFRPAYLDIVNLREVFPDVRIVALTATATPQVQDDIVKYLGLQTPQVYKGTFLRDNLYFVVRNTEDKEQKLLEILTKVKGSAIVYVRSRKKAKDLSLLLYNNNIYADYYHAGLPNDVRHERQDTWMQGRIRVMVATNAFGMGIDKSDVRLVVHFDLPDNLEAYYQEAGRAGRDGKKAYAVLLIRDRDIKDLRTNLKRAYPEAAYLKRVYQALANYFKIATGSSEFVSYDFDIDKFCQTYQLSTFEAYHAIHRLEDQGFIELGEGFYNPSKLMINLDKSSLYDYQVRNEKKDPLIKLLLRRHGGELFTNFKNISESTLAKALNMTTYNVVNVLFEMHKQGVIYYDRVKDKPQITFLTPRFDASTLPIDFKRLDERKRIAHEKLDKIEGYIYEAAECRQRFIANYFGENIEDDCGRCDNCISSSQHEQFIPNEQDVNSVLNAIKEVPLTLKELDQRVQLSSPNLLSTVIDNLLAVNAIIIDDEGLIKALK